MQLLNLETESCAWTQSCHIFQGNRKLSAEEREGSSVDNTILFVVGFRHDFYIIVMHCVLMSAQWSTAWPHHTIPHQAPPSAPALALALALALTVIRSLTLRDISMECAHSCEGTKGLYRPTLDRPLLLPGEL